MTSGADDAQAAHELDLVSRAAKGDEAAFDRFFDKHAAAAQLLVERLLGPGAAADEVVVEAFEKTVRRLPLLGARNSSPGIYVLSTARNGAYASLGRERPTPPDGPLGALLALPSRQRELLALRELGLTEAECAEVAGIEPGEVGVQVARARLRMVDQLEGLSLSGVFADDRAERLLAAEVVRGEGHALPPELDEEITSHADGDSRFAAALSAVRSPSRSVGQLPPAGGTTRLLGEARTRAVGAGRPLRPAAAAAGAGAAGGANPAGAAAAPPSIPSAPRSTSDPYDDSIGDEMAWGIVEDEDDSGLNGEPAPAPEPKVGDPSDGQWEDGAGAVSAEPSPEPVGSANPVAPGGPTAPGPTDPSLTDPFAGWDDVDWAEEDRDWAAGPGVDPGQRAAAAAAAAAAIGAGDASNAAGEAEPLSIADLTNLGATRPFDAVAAGLADPDDDATLVAARGAGAFDDDLGEPPAGPRSKWRIVLWVLVFLALFAGGGLAAYAYFSARNDPELPPASRITETTPKVSGTTSERPRSSTPKSTTKKPSSTTGSSGASSSGAASSGAGAATGGTGGGSATAGGGGTGAAAGTADTGAAGGATTKTKKPDTSQVVSGGDATSGGAVRGSGDATSTTP